MATDVIIPALGESISEASVGQWLKQPGDAVAADEPIVSLETDKVAVEVPSPVAGTMGEQLFKVGDTVAVGARIAIINAGGEAAAPAPAKAEPAPAVAAPAAQPAAAPAAAPAPSPAPAAPAAAAAPAAGAALEAMGPAVRTLVDSYNLDIASIQASGRDGRLTKGDVLAAIEAGTARVKATPAAAAAPAPVAAAAPVEERREERVRMTRLRQTIARRLKEAQNTAAMLTTFNDVDMTAVMATRARYKDLFEKKHGVRLGFMSFFSQAVVLALRDVPAVGAAIEGDELVYRNYADLGIAVSSPGGLVVPVLRNADKLSFAETELAIGDFGKRAQSSQLKIEELQGGNFTISNGGVFGSLMSTPILNTPQSGVLGLHRIEERPVVRDGQIVIRPMMYLALSYDHRVVDGREAVTFLVRVKEAIEDPARLLIDL
ncbi:2-oxoglutarate dehydrogenase complex dihydrolipoyllysine-residue succinyltransferase [Polymorphobacter fuscus]|uniref:Dihydrolipoyllysine-residue succinyltransferase component of 2-oxoglutarate dehydrogenase complex n=1 Tax=Sandarakinorhabdus fusca TaxID=1439888 RepID=A0A7C9GND5_9SPHN|nr:2-oxoglutarate dehydrogenase complex dihydrolipoyllysine-residue succinyltransferase [Polymorphobacter fuscus]KAB7648357.1 2-oxoglutarate dehydrogenase complex dihydrolipoyllysine-residue succinyltransferase [Polymorphobacter fuscus]MQT15870.1 2-oxoglutarate dehydrogenase complex dihydrolipoyllysine-residue succinyltransferase [Polymorphobacter fuscus]NJC07857.1 2-oxoglutarate dehydrogenase E2 component (dihydrolipoamide succinyltransferase) [Polymorphobacter fuscus]